MKSVHLRLLVLGLFAAALAGSYASEAAEPQPVKELASFGVLRATAPDTARTQAQEWLKSTGKYDAAAFTAIWSQTDRSVLDLVTDSLCLGNADAKKLIEAAREANVTAPKQVPDLLKDTKLPVFFRSNLVLAWAKALVSCKVYDEALEALKTVKVENVVDPAAYFFNKAVAEHGLDSKEDARRTIGRLIDDVPDAPERYKTVAALMFLDMEGWTAKNLDAITRKMGNSGRRLDLARGGPQTQKIQKDIIARLDEKIKEYENKQKSGQGQGQGQGESPGCPPSGQPGSGNQPGQGAGNPTSPQQDSYGGNNSGPGKANEQRFKEIVEGWGKLPPTERTKAMTEMIRGMPPAYQKMIEEFYKRGAGNP